MPNTARNPTARVVEATPREALLGLLSAVRKILGPAGLASLKRPPLRPKGPCQGIVTNFIRIQGEAAYPAVLRRWSGVMRSLESRMRVLGYCDLMVPFKFVGYCDESEDDTCLVITCVFARAADWSACQLCR